MSQKCQKRTPRAAVRDGIAYILGLSRLLESLPKPECGEHDERTYERGYDIAKRDRYLVEAGEQPKHSEQQTANERTGKADCQVAQQAEAPAFPGREQPGKASTKQANNDPDDQLINRRHRPALG